MSIFDVDGYYCFVTERFPELHEISLQVRRDHGDDLYPMLWELLAPILINVGAHGAKVRRRQSFELVDGLLAAFPEVSNEVGVGIVEVAPAGWFEVAREYAGANLRERLDLWEPGWLERHGPRTRASDPYGVERTLKLK